MVSRFIDDSSDEETDDERNYSEDEFSDEEESNSKDHNCRAQECFAQPKRVDKRKDEVMLDSGSTISIFKDEHLIQNIRTAKQKLMLYTNSGKRL